MTVEEKEDFGNAPIMWAGDLADDCSALWAGLLLRAEWMDDDDWWWAVYDMQKKEITIDASYEYEIRFTTGAAARAKAEEVARRYVGG